MPIEDRFSTIMEEWDIGHIGKGDLIKNCVYQEIYKIVGDEE